MINRIKEKLEELGYPDSILFGKKKELQELKQWVITSTSWLPTKTPTTFRLYCIVNDITQMPKCECGKDVSVKPRNGNGLYESYTFTEFCSRSCMRSSRKTVEKRTNTMIDKYGDHNMKTNKGKEEYKAAILEKYGVDSVMKVKEIAERSLKNDDGTWRITDAHHKAKTKETNNIRYGGHPMKVKEIAQKARNTFVNNNTLHPSQYDKPKSVLEVFHNDEKFKNLVELRNRRAEIIAAELGYHVSRIRSRMAELGVQNETKMSLAEEEIGNFIESLGLHILRGDRAILGGRELDILVKEKNVAVEFNGLYWHSEACGRTEKYHQQKKIDCLDKNINLITIWEHDYKNNKELILNKIKHILGFSEKRVYARKCDVKEVTQKESNDFYEKTHIQGKVRTSISYSLQYEGEIVACISFIKRKNGIYDLSRFATSCSVIGGFSKLLSYFKKNNEWSVIETFASLDYSDGSLYEKNGFENFGVTRPNYIYYNNKKAFTLSRYQCMKHKLHNVIDDFDPSLTENENMNRNSWYRVYDCGSIKYVMKKENPLN